MVKDMLNSIKINFAILMIIWFTILMIDDMIIIRSIDDRNKKWILYENDLGHDCDNWKIRIKVFHMTFDKNNVKHLRDAMKNAKLMDDMQEYYYLRDRIMCIEEIEKKAKTK